jgi:hypothetical protein
MAEAVRSRRKPEGRPAREQPGEPAGRNLHRHALDLAVYSHVGTLAKQKLSTDVRIVVIMKKEKYFA